MRKQLIYYPNCSKGGVATVIRGRAAANPDIQFHCVFVNDRGGRDAFADLPNVHARIVRRDRLNAYLSHLAFAQEYERVSILSDARAANELMVSAGTPLVYEFHSSNLSVIEQEAALLDSGKLDHVIVPSDYLKASIETRLILPSEIDIRVERNLVDHNSFHSGNAGGGFFAEDVVPLLWIGRFDRGKGVNYLLRALRMLPERYEAFIVLSLESDPARAADFLGEAAANGVLKRIHLLMNVPQARLGEIYREARDRSGAMISTSMMESFGYSVAESLACGLNVHAFELPVFREHGGEAEGLYQVDTGNVAALASSIRRVSRV